MGNPKQRWNPWRAEEEKALTEGIAKHGEGKWKLIKGDPLFSFILSNRTNIDLKDKWRNMKTAGLGNTRSRTPNPRPTPAEPLVAHVELVKEEPIKEEPVKAIPDTEYFPRNNEERFIFEALESAEEQNGMDADSIFSYIKARTTVESLVKFRRQIMSSLKKLTRNGTLDKVENCYRLKSNSRKRQRLIPATLKVNESLYEAAKTAAYKVAEADEKTYYAALSVKEAERLSKIEDEANLVFQLAQEIFNKCHATRDVLVA